MERGRRRAKVYPGVRAKARLQSVPVSDSRDVDPLHGKTKFGHFNDAVRAFLKAPKAKVEARERELHKKRKARKKRRAAAAG